MGGRKHIGRNWELLSTAGGLTYSLAIFTLCRKRKEPLLQGTPGGSQPGARGGAHYGTNLFPFLRYQVQSPGERRLLMVALEVLGAIRYK
jgi:hypothetical protein